MTTNVLHVRRVEPILKPAITVHTVGNNFVMHAYKCITTYSKGIQSMARRMYQCGQILMNMKN